MVTKTTDQKIEDRAFRRTTTGSILLGIVSYPIIHHYLPEGASILGSYAVAGTSMFLRISSSIKAAREYYTNQDRSERLRRMLRS